MKDFDEYEFWLDAYTPQTIPMERLAQYLAALAKMLGHGASVHFDRLEPGSTVQVVRVERADAFDVLQRVEQVLDRRSANDDAVAGFDEINRMLRDDGAIGRLSRRPAEGGDSGVILRFEGRELAAPVSYGPFTETAVVEGELVRIGGKDKNAHALIIDPEGKIWPGDVSRELACELAPYLYKGAVLRVSGDARWIRNEAGQWKLQSFRIHSYESLAEDTLLAATERLRSLHKTDWDSINDLDAFITSTRGESDGLH